MGILKRIPLMVRVAAITAVLASGLTLIITFAVQGSSIDQAHPPVMITTLVPKNAQDAPPAPDGNNPADYNPVDVYPEQGHVAYITQTIQGSTGKLISLSCDASVSSTQLILNGGTVDHDGTKVTTEIEPDGSLSVAIEGNPFAMSMIVNGIIGVNTPEDAHTLHLPKPDFGGSKTINSIVLCG